MNFGLQTEISLIVQFSGLHPRPKETGSSDRDRKKLAGKREETVGAALLAFMRTF